MNKFAVVIIEQAQKDLRNLSNTISYEYQSPATAIKYLREIYQALSVQKSTYFLQYGFNVRRLNYKKMTIIYTVIDYTAYIQRVVPSSTILD